MLSNTTINSDGTLVQNINNTLFINALQGSGTVSVGTGSDQTLTYLDFGGSTNSTFSGIITGGAGSASTANNAGNRVV